MLFFDANQFRPQLEQTMGEALGRKVTIGSIKAALLSGGVAVEDLSIADDPAFSAAPFVTAKAVTVGVNLLPLIFSRSVRVQAIRLNGSTSRASPLGVGTVEFLGARRRVVDCRATGSRRR